MSNNTKFNSHWVLIQGTPNFSYKNLVAIYHQTSKEGFADYRVYAANDTKRTTNTLLGIGGLPGRGLSDRLNALASGGLS
jgi:hypothetical protein